MSKLFEHQPHPHQVRNVNILHKKEQQSGSFNQRLAVWITQATSTMVCAYVFAGLAIIGLLGILGILSPFTILLITWISQTFLQLTFLPILSVGQATLNRHSELLAEEQFNTTQKTFHDTEEIMRHLDMQDSVILEMLKHIEAMEVRSSSTRKRREHETI